MRFTTESLVNLFPLDLTLPVFYLTRSLYNFYPFYVSLVQ